MRRGRAALMRALRARGVCLAARLGTHGRRTSSRVPSRCGRRILACASRGGRAAHARLRRRRR
eukprot:3232026-Prymnesium_polylepis.1